MSDGRTPGIGVGVQVHPDIKVLRAAGSSREELRQLRRAAPCGAAELLVPSCESLSRGDFLDVNLSFRNKRRPERVPRHANVRSMRIRSDQLKATSIMLMARHFMSVYFLYTYCIRQMKRKQNRMLHLQN